MTYPSIQNLVFHRHRLAYDLSADFLKNALYAKKLSLIRRWKDPPIVEWKTGRKIFA